MHRVGPRMFICMSAAGVFALTSIAAAQSTFDAPRGEFVEHMVDSGLRLGIADRSSVVFSTVIHHDRALWTRLHFADVQLPPGSTVRMTSLLDGEVQELDRDGMAMWSNASAFFNGDSVQLDLIAGPGTTDNRIVVDRVMVEFAEPGMPIGTCGICGGDSRVPSDEDWTGRLAPNGCTASIYNEQSCVVSAGHCMGSNNAVHFRVPNSTPGCNTQNPGVADQFPITGQLFQNGGVGNDWAVMTLGTNNLGQTAYERYGVYRPIAAAPAPNGAAVSVWGYGQSQTCTLTYTQQLSQGSINSVQSDHYRALIDVTFGNSGSALIRNGEIIGIVTHCATCGTGNIMNRVDTPAFVNARNSLCSAPPDNNTCATAMPVGNGQTAFSNVGATTNGPDESTLCNFEGNSNIQADVWFTYTATCTGEVTFSMCDGQQPPQGGDCQGFCGGQSPAGCWCDEQCDGIGDCCVGVCDDCPNLSFCSTAGPCAGHCGGQAPEGCWCDEICDGAGDCCPGVCNDCPNLSHCNLAGGAGLSGFDAKMAIYTACPTGSNQAIACNKDSCGALPSITVPATAGQTFIIRIGGHNGDTGDGILTIDCEQGTVCPEDLNGDGFVDVSDLLQLLGAWGSCPACVEDINGDGVVDVSDLLQLLGAWGPC